MNLEKKNRKLFAINFKQKELLGITYFSRDSELNEL